MNGKVAVLIGSDSDRETIESANNYFEYFNIEMDLKVMSLPWEPNYSLTDRLWILPHSILVYSALSLPFGQILMRLLKLASLKNSEKVNQI